MPGGFARQACHGLGQLVGRRSEGRPIERQKKRLARMDHRDYDKVLPRHDAAKVGYLQVSTAVSQLPASAP